MKRTLYLIVAGLFVQYNLEVIAQELLDEKKAFSAFLSLEGVDVEQYSDEYFLRFDSKVYQNQHEDEFERRRVIEELIKESKNIIENENYYISTKADFGIYDFDSCQFNFKPFQKETVINLCDYLFISRLQTNTKITVTFLNGTEISALPMSYDKANFLVKMRKDKRTGEVDRTVYLKVIFKIDDNAEIVESGETRKNVTLFAYITTLEVYQTPDFLSEPIAIIETDFKALEQIDSEEKSETTEYPDKMIEAISDMDRFLSSNKNIDKEMKTKIIQMMLDSQQ